jgi:eukaryotic-like serine/threonine-protein kinase
VNEDAGPAARVGSVIKGKWTVDSLLGVGGMAAVYAATHRNNQRAALKILHTDFAREKTICERFLREAYVSNKVGHSATVQVLDDDVTELDEPFLVMELLEGQTVRDAWKKAGRAMQPTDVLAISEAVLDCLAACHSIGVIHRDLKPANIFLTDEGVVKVLDFGVAQFRSATAERTATGTALGTPAYMSPEQAMGLVDQLDGRADLFSVGAMMHALITGHRINNGRTEQEALVMAATKPVPSVARIAPNLPIELIQIVDKSLQWDRRNRFADAREMQAAVTEALYKLGGQLAPRKGGGAAAPAPLPPPAPALPGHTAVMAAPQVGQALAQPPAQMTPSQPLVSPSQGLPAEARRSAPQPALPATAALGMYAPGVVPHSHQSQKPQVAPGEVLVPENDPRIQATRDLMRHVDRTLPSVRQFGWSHPATERTLRTAFEAFAEGLNKDPDVLSFTLRPYSFLVFGHTVWEPGPPFDAIPYNLFAAGMRNLRLDQGLSLDELRDFFTLLLVDPGRDLPPEDDIAAAFWERGMPHVHHESVDAFAEGDATEREAFYNESDQLEAMAGSAARQHSARVEAKAMAVSTDRSALGKAQRGASPLALDDVVRAVFAQQLDLGRDKWSERYIDALVEGYLDSAVNRDAPLVLASLRKSSADLVVAGRMEVVVQLQQAVTERLSHRVRGSDLAKLAGAFTNALFGAEVLELTLKYLRDHPEKIEVFVPILASISGNDLPTMLNGLKGGFPEAVRLHILGYIERVMANREGEVGAAAVGAEPEAASALLNLLARAGTQQARHVLVSLSTSDDVNVRIEAKVLSAGNPDAAQNELGQMLDNQSALVRMAALRTSARYRVKGVWPAVARAVKAPAFNELGLDERRELLRALVVLGPQSGEPMVLEIAKKGGVLLTEEKEATRLAAIETLGELSHSGGVSMALHEVSQSRWGSSEDTRAAAANAARLINQRIREGGGPTP